MRRERAGEGVAIEPVVALDADIEGAVAQRPGHAEENIAVGELARIWLRREDHGLAERFAECFTVGDEGQAPELILETIAP